MAVASDLNALGDRQCIIQLNTKIADRAVHLGVTKKKLNGSEVTCLLVNLRHFGSSK